MEPASISEPIARIRSSGLLEKYPDEIGEAEELARAIEDIGEATGRLSSDLLPRATQPGITGEELISLLGDIREELRHLDYHLHASAYLRHAAATLDPADYPRQAPEEAP